MHIMKVCIKKRSAKEYSKERNKHLDDSKFGLFVRKHVTLFSVFIRLFIAQKI